MCTKMYQASLDNNLGNESTLVLALFGFLLTIQKIYTSLQRKRSIKQMLVPYTFNILNPIFIILVTHCTFDEI